MKARHEFDSDEAYNEYLLAYFSGMAMQGWIGRIEKTDTPEELVLASVNLADRLIKALNNTEDEA